MPMGKPLTFIVVWTLSLLTGCLAIRPNGEGVSDFKDNQLFANAPIGKPRERFDAILLEIDGAIQKAKAEDDEEVRIKSLSLSKILVPLRHFQVLIYLYQKQYPAPKKYYKEAKMLEDLIGKQSDLDAFLSEAQGTGDRAAIAKAEKNRKKNSDQLKVYIAESNWFAKHKDVIREIRDELDHFHWMSMEDDRNMVLSRLAKKLKKQHESTYNLNLPEEGMHELRRDVRRFRYMNEATSLLVQSDITDKCSALTVAQYDQLSSALKSNLVPEVAPKPAAKPQSDYFCHVESCLTQKLEYISSSLVPLKFQGSLQLARGEPVSPEIIRQAQALYEDLTKSNVYLFLWSQLGSCQTKAVEDQDDDLDDDL